MLFHFLNEDYSCAVENNLHNLQDSDKPKNDSYFKKSIAFFEVLKTNASGIQMAEYSRILKKIFKGEIVNDLHSRIG